MAKSKPQRIRLESEAALAAWNEGREAWNAYVAANPDDGLKSLDGDADYPELRGAAAMALWRKGEEAWNDWVAANPRADVNFFKQHFEADAKDWAGEPLIDFRYFEFPDGNVSFDFATFGEGHVSFASTRFGEGHVSFAGATFGEGDVSFDYATFGEGAVDFDDATFGEGDLSFYRATFGEGHVGFGGATFGEGDVSFDYATLNKGEVYFSRASFGRGAVSLRNLSFEGVARFDDLRTLEQCTQFSFEGCSFDKLFTFSHQGRMGCPLDLRRTKLSHGVVLHDVQCDYGEVPSRLWLKKASDPKDSQRFRRLKELALSEANGAKALEFNAQELRSQRGHETGWLRDGLQFFYMLCSDYGRSVLRPLISLCVVTLLFGANYAQLAINPKTLSFMDALPAAMTYSGGNMFAFVPIGRTALEQSRMDLFGEALPYELLWIAGLQSVLSVILLFLLGLGLRNMFRL